MVEGVSFKAMPPCCPSSGFGLRPSLIPSGCLGQEVAPLATGFDGPSRAAAEEPSRPFFADEEACFIMADRATEDC